MNNSCDSSVECPRVTAEELFEFESPSSMLLFLLLFIVTSLSDCECHERPNIVLIIADDLGWNDVGFHGSNQIPTPNIDIMAWSGVSLHNYYVTPICTPSRAALMTGKYPIHTGMQHTVIFAAEPRGLPLTEKILPQYLKELGYKTHLVGKWHLGSYKKEYLPLNRGFDSHLGFWNGKIDMYDHTNQEKGYWGFDFRRDFSTAHDLFGQYATDVYTNEAVKIIKSHNTSSPLFLMLSHSAVHTGNPSEPIRAPEKLFVNFTHIQDFQRRKFAAVLTKLDESVGEVVAALKAKGVLNDSIVVFTTDNGGAAAGFNDNAASNYPLRGVKNTLWEGGVRGAGWLWSPFIDKRSRVATQRMHLVDWLPTLLSAAGMNVSSIKHIDGVDQWCALSQDLPSARESLVHNIDDEYGSASITYKQWKVHKGTNYGGSWDGWYGPAGREGAYDTTGLLASKAAGALLDMGMLPDTEHILRLRSEATVECGDREALPCRPLEAPCLFNIDEDPCETRNLADIHPDVLQMMLKELDRVNRTAVPPNNQPLTPVGDPKYWGYVITNFGDYINNEIK
ncbi:arylsulfatase B-like isoform X1 [Danaus plexippus]|uniref:arylsulfatase B-like isoform X1 n=2 Tax=Danaus plexippus TaxID=13037 RepID=UPI002AAF928F|nr:arylsulfatase B-like isoform X1 [Danaus plexippus]